MDMKKMLLGSVLMAISTMALAGTASDGISSIVATNNEAGIAVTGNLFNYQEHITPGPSDTESGWTPGFQVKASVMRDLMGLSNVYGQVKFSYNSGGIDYHGAVENLSTGTATPYDTTDDSTQYRILGRLGKGFAITDNAMLTPYVAIGYQHWNRHLVGPYGYTEDYSAVLTGLGVKGQYALTQRLVLGANAEFLAVVDGQMTPNLDGLPLGTANFGTTGEERVGMDADYRLMGGLHLFGNLDYTHYDYTGGNLNYGFYEPFSASNQFAVGAGLAYSF
ncbi:hypothetical protein HFV02_08295 [Acidithiobacillus caldus]|jgi:hypothetical protein|nr:hypothetical protein [Acidithiobacillus caldus]